MNFDRTHNGRTTAEVTCGTDQAGIKSPTLKREKIFSLTKRINLRNPTAKIFTHSQSPIHPEGW